ncbi:glycosyltransferase family 2 protein [Aliiroseovarius sp. PrR006]|uniref:glycosyltransferase family 2 protein n=1 Tax=Aliiroseovarius sp. PrR006 TaxID=2706883 RepID=UPI0013D2A2CE|nr:glycosyltransferase family 2 protein [Aliiroseovarius sp. PrR006]NDW54794.1 hypothetical protein [Aliiroseovarius sp. PrR006]
MPHNARTPRGSFAVCSLVRETLPDMCRFVTHYLRAGAEHIYINFDGSQAEASEHIAAFADVEAVTIAVCDAEFWQKTYPKESVPKLVPKQIAVRKIAIGLNQSDWLLFCDAGEFVVGDEMLGTVLSRLPNDCPGVVIRNSEAVWGGAWFRTRLDATSRSLGAARWIVWTTSFQPGMRISGSCISTPLAMTAGVRSGKAAFLAAQFQALECLRVSGNGR